MMSRINLRVGLLSLALGFVNAQATA